MAPYYGFGIPELERDVGSPAGAEAPEPLGAVLDGEGPHPLQPVRLQSAPATLTLQTSQLKNLSFIKIKELTDSNAQCWSSVEHLSISVWFRGSDTDTNPDPSYL